MRRAQLCVLALLVAAGCGDAVPAAEDLAVADDGTPALDDGGAQDGGAGDGGTSTLAPEVQSGTRLRAKVHVGGTGAQLFSTWHDTALDVDCSFARSEDGSERCYPSGGTVYYANMDCTGALYYAHPSCEAPPKLVTGYNAMPCLGRPIYRVGAAVSTPAMYYYKDPFSGACGAQAPAATDTVYAATTASSTELVAGAQTREARGARLAVEVLRSSDGAVEARTIWDSQRAFHCEVLGDQAGAPDVCKPVYRGYTNGNWFTDTACTSRIGFVPRTSFYNLCDEEPGAISYSAGTSSMLTEVGAPYTGTIYIPYSSCHPSMPSEIPDGARFFNVGVALPASSLAPLLTSQEGSERLRTRAITTPTGERLRGVDFFDQVRNEACAPTSAADGVLRCMPAGREAYTYQDAACSVPILIVDQGAAVPALARMGTYSDLCTPRTHLYAVNQTPLVLSEIFFSNGPADCSSAPTGSSASYHGLTEIAPSELAPTPLVQQ